MGSAGAPSYKGRLTWDAETGGFVLTADYNLEHPVAIIKGISATAAARLQQHLEPGAPYPIPMNRGDTDFKMLLDCMTPDGSVLPF